MEELVFKSDTKHRKQFFTGVSFSHPAKMMLPLEMWLIDNYSKVGDVILDPMGGSGTLLVACAMGRHVITVELEDKFVQMQRGNWAKIQERGPMMGYQMGTATILQGDARNLTGVLADRIITSPPYAEASEGAGIAKRGYHGAKHSDHDIGSRSYMPSTQGTSDGQISTLPYSSIAAVISSPPYANRLADSAVNDGDTQRMSYRQALGKVDTVISSPPYEAVVSQGEGSLAVKAPHASQGFRMSSSYTKHGVDAILTSPPYEHQIHRNSDEGKVEAIKAINPANYVEHSQPVIAALYSPTADNIGNLKSDSYLAAMLTVYRNCFTVLKAGGLMCLVTKNFIRNQKEVRLDLDTIKLCEQAGFIFKERHYRKLTNQSFWRTIYQQKYPDAPVLDKEDILIFERKSCP